MVLEEHEAAPGAAAPLTQSTAPKCSGIKPSPLLTTRDWPSLGPRPGSTAQGSWGM